MPIPIPIPLLFLSLLVVLLHRVPASATRGITPRSVLLLRAPILAPTLSSNTTLHKRTCPTSRRRRLPFPLFCQQQQPPPHKLHKPPSLLPILPPPSSNNPLPSPPLLPPYNEPIDPALQAESIPRERVKAEAAVAVAETGGSDRGGGGGGGRGARPRNTRWLGG
ncbi:hypothetical protein VTK26DRAFT_7219 [Humicola hyalothermophila]